jgi:RNA polymerase sigma-70 factor (ECF subfamily)
VDNENLHTEQALLRLVAAGNMQAYQQLFEMYWDQVYGTGLRLTKAPEQAKDLVQDIFLKVWDNREKLQGVRNFSAYLYMTTKNLIHDQVRSRVFRESNREFLTNYFAYTESSPQLLLEQKEMGEVLEAAINKLPPKLREVINLRRLEGLSHKEIAIRLNISYISSKTYMVRALMALRKEMSRHAGKLLFITSLLCNFL